MIPHFIDHWQAEFGRAAVERLLAGRKPVAKYFGVFRKEQSDVIHALGGVIYNHWDDGPDAPPKQRPAAAARAEPTLQVLQLRNRNLVFPDSVMSKFAVGSTQHIELVKLKESVERDSSCNVAAADSGAAPVTSLQRGNPVRATGRPDWSVEGGLRPLNLEKVIQLENVPTESLELSRLEFCGKFSTIIQQ